MSRMSELHADIARDLDTDYRCYVVASLIGHCEAIAASGELSQPAEQSLRLLIAETLSAFGMQHHQQEQAA